MKQLLLLACVVGLSPAVAAGGELWSCNGNGNGTAPVQTADDGTMAIDPDSFVIYDGRLYFVADDGRYGRQLWSTNGASRGTSIVVTSPRRLLNPAQLTVYDGRLYFSADDGLHGVELWSTNGSEAGTAMVMDINTVAAPNDRKREQTQSSRPADLTVFNNRLYFTADNGIEGRQLWSTNGAEPGTTIVKQIGDGPDGCQPGNLLVYDGKLYFTADDGEHGVELWSTNGNQAGTAMVVDVNTQTSTSSGKQTRSSNPSNLTVFKGRLYFTADDGIHGVELWRTNGSEAGAEMVMDVNVVGVRGKNKSNVTQSSSPADLTEYNGLLYFTADNGIEGRQLWSTNGSEAGTAIVMPIRDHPDGCQPANLTVFKNLLYFTADDGANGFQLWSTNGTQAGTAMVRRIGTKADGCRPANLTVFKGQLYFAADDGVNGPLLWSTTGSSEGTAMVVEVAKSKDKKGASARPYPARPQSLFVFKGQLYFSAVTR
jgi:trimeric autotransporter adhesin